MIDVVMPQMGESIVEGTLTKWTRKVGEKIERDEPLFEISPIKSIPKSLRPPQGPWPRFWCRKGRPSGLIPSSDASMRAAVP